MAGNASAIRAGRAFVELFTKDEDLRKGLNQAQKLLNDFGKGVQTLGLRIASLGAGLVTTLIAPALALKRLRDQAAELGFGLGPKDAAIADALALALKRLQAAFIGGLLKVGVAVAPVLTRVVDLLTRFLEVATKFIDKNRGLVVGVLAAGAAMVVLGAAIYGVGVAISALGTVIGGITTIAGAIGTAWGAFTAVLSAPWLLAIGAAFVAAAGGLYLFFTRTQAGQQILSNFIQFLGYLAGRIKQVVASMADAFSAGNLQLAVQIMWKGVEVEFLKALVFLRSFVMQYRAMLAAIMPASLLFDADLGSVIGDAAALAKAVGELENLRKQAAKEAAEASKDSGFAAATKIGSTAGTFNAAHGISRLGNTDFPKRIAVATETMVRLMQNSVRGGGPANPAVVK